MTVEISFIIPVYNEEKLIELCLNTIIESCKKGDVQCEIIVVDNGSIDNTFELAKKVNSKVFRINRSSVSAARNYGVSKSKYDLIAFIDSDVLITDRWIQEFIENYIRFKESHLFISGCQYRVRSNGTWIEMNWFKHLKDKLINGGNLITSRKLFEQIGGFDYSLKTGEDYEFCLRAQRNGALYDVNDGFKAIHLGYPRTLKQFVLRECWHGEGDFKSLKRFFSSKVAVLSSFYLFLQIVILIFLIAGYINAFLMSLLILFALNIVVTYLRFKKCKIIVILINSILNFLYFNARAASFFRAVYRYGREY